MLGLRGCVAVPARAVGWGLGLTTSREVATTSRVTGMRKIEEFTFSDCEPSLRDLNFAE